MSYFGKFFVLKLTGYVSLAFPAQTGCRNVILDELVESRSERPNLRFSKTCINHRPNGSGYIGFLARWTTVFNGQSFKEYNSESNCSRNDAMEESFTINIVIELGND